MGESLLCFEGGFPRRLLKCWNHLSCLVSGVLYIIEASVVNDLIMTFQAILCFFVQHILFFRSACLLVALLLLLRVL